MRSQQHFYFLMVVTATIVKDTTSEKILCGRSKRKKTQTHIQKLQAQINFQEHTNISCSTQFASVIVTPFLHLSNSGV